MATDSATASIQPYGTLDDGTAVHLYTLTNAAGMTAQLTDFGALLVSLAAPDRDGKLADVTVGFGDLAGWRSDPMYRGATVGRFGNRIKGGKFTLDHVDYPLAQNNHPNHLHGGDIGFNKRMWQAEPVSQPGATGIQFKRHSPHGEEGYPGNMDVQATYWLNDENAFIAEFAATTDAPTIVNMVQHTYWNLTGDFVNHDILDHELTLFADHYLPIDNTAIPTAEAPAPVAGTPMDFNQPRKIGARIDADFEPLANGSGYDHAWVINGEPNTLRPVAKAKDPVSGRVLELWADQPAVQLYTGNFMNGGAGRNGLPMNRRHAFCLETEGFPDAPNRPDFPSCVLRPGETYRHTMVHTFSAE